MKNPYSKFLIILVALLGLFLLNRSYGIFPDVDGDSIPDYWMEE